MSVGLDRKEEEREMGSGLDSRGGEGKNWVGARGEEDEEERKRGLGLEGIHCIH